MITLFLFSDYTGMFDTDHITPEYRNTIKVDGVSTGKLNLNERTYPITDGQAAVPLEAFMGNKIEVTVTARQNGLLKHWSGETLSKTRENVFSPPAPASRDILLQLRRENENQLTVIKKNTADIEKINKQLKSKLIAGGAG